MTIAEFFHRLRHRFWSTETALLLVRPADRPLDRALLQDFHGSFYDATEKNIRDCGAFESAKRYVPTYQAMLQRGDLVEYGYLNGQCVFRHCVQLSGDIFHEGCPVKKLGQNEAYIHYLFCAPAARGRGFQTNALLHAAERLRGYTFFALVEPDNVTSLHNCYNTGFEAAERITVKCRLFRRFLERETI